MTLQEITQQTVSGLSLELVEIVRTAGGTLRITIDVPWRLEGPTQFIQVDDCERVTRQLQYALEVEGIDYKRLEVSSPGIDRRLGLERDLLRFVGFEVDITLKEPLEGKRRKYRGKLEMLENKEAVQHWQIVWVDAQAKPLKPGARVSKKRIEAATRTMGFVWSEVSEARLAPVVNFKGMHAPSGPVPHE